MTVNRTRGILGTGARLGGVALALAFSVAVGSAATTTKKPADGTKPAPTVAVTTPAQRCTDLEKQFDTSLPKHTDAKNLTAAKKLRAEGQKRCDAGKHAVGALWLARALTDLGVQVDDDDKQP